MRSSSRALKREHTGSPDPNPPVITNQQPTKFVRRNEGALYTRVLLILKVTTLAVILVAALRILVCPKNLSDTEMRFLWWALGTAVTVLGASTAASRKQ
jgi:hypothetical protein